MARDGEVHATEDPAGGKEWGWMISRSPSESSPRTSGCVIRQCDDIVYEVYNGFDLLRKILHSSMSIAAGVFRVELMAPHSCASD